MRNKNKNETKLKDHKQNGKILNPPFLAHDFNMKTSSWFDERLPEMLWAVLIIGNIERGIALDFFRYVAKFVQENNDCLDITMTGISRLSKDKKEQFMEYITGYSEIINNVLRTMLLFPELPSFKNWEKFLQKSNSDDDWQKLSEGVSKTFWHQSQEATDCRWVRILCEIVGGKMNFTTGMEESIRGILEYPNYGDMKSVRPTIRSMELTYNFTTNESKSTWGLYFWKFCFDKTQCLPEEAVSEKIKNRQKDLSEEMENTRKHLFDETSKVRNRLIDHFFKNSLTSSIDSRHEGAFGLALYGLSLFIENILYRTSLSITGRLGLRALIEVNITLAYLLKKEKNEPKVWDDYRSYGTGQIKSIYLKLQEITSSHGSIELDSMDYIANEDKWVEFVPINLGHWDSVNLRKMSEEVGLKEVYDKFYNYTSCFMHGNWGAVRESIYQLCLNPLHRGHRLPIYDLPLMPNITIDSMVIMNNILNLLNETYPGFDTTITSLQDNLK